jgi:hypothetical protein
MAAGFGIAILVETVVLHLWLGARHPAWTWSLTVVSVASLVWLVVEYRATRDAAVTLDSEIFDLVVGHRFVLRVPRTQVVAAIPATWRDVPDKTMPEYLNATAPAQPNVLMTFSSPARVRLLGGLAKRSVTRLGLCLDEPARFIEAVER